MVVVGVDGGGGGGVRRVGDFGGDGVADDYVRFGGGGGGVGGSGFGCDFGDCWWLWLRGG